MEKRIVFDEFGILHIRETQSEEVFAKKADVYVTVRGVSLFMGDAALSKAREVNALLTELRALGLKDGDFKLLGVQADVSTGVLGRNSSASYRLKIHCERLEALPDILGVITSQKNTAVNQLEWDYGDLDEVENRLLDRCIERAGRKANRVAAGLGEKISGVQRFEETGHRPQREELALAMAQYGSSGDAAKRRMTAQDLGMEISHSRQVSVGVTIEYRIAKIADGAA